MTDNQTHSSFYGCPYYLRGEEDPLKKKVLVLSQKISHFKSMQILIRSRATNSSLRLVLLKIQTHSRFYGCPCNLKE